MKLTRPPFVLSHPADASGCGFHRIIRPSQILGRMGYLNGRAEVSFLDDRILQAINPDVIVLQRQAEDAQIEVVQRYKRACPNAFIVFEIDDALSAVPDKSWHAPYMTPNIDAKLRKAAREADVVTVTTQELADHMAKVCDPGTKIRVVPNMLGLDDMESCFAIRQQLKRSTDKKLRIGWGGGIGHIGDLQLLNEAMTILKDEVDWYFVGMDPVVPPGVTKHFLGSVPPERYLASLQAMNCDLMVAPLESNLFNECKSNLRLLEAGACNYPVIATPIAPYLHLSPPIGYARTTLDWVDAIRKFIALSPEARFAEGDALNKWVRQNFVMDSQPEKRLQGWLPDDTRPFKPKLNAAASGVVEVHTDEQFNAALKTTNDILYLRPGAVIQPAARSRLIASSGDIICGLSNDGGPWGFPNTNQFTHLDPLSMANIDKVCNEMADANLIDLGVLSGPCVLLRRKALAAVGYPDTNLMSLELAILDWACNAKAHGLTLKLNPSVFVAATQTYGARSGEAEMAQARIQYCWPRAENDDAALKALREEIEIRFHREAYRTMPPQDRGNYKHWFESQRRGPAMHARAGAWSSQNGGLPDISDCAYPGHMDAESDWVFFYPKDAQVPDDAWNLFHEALVKSPDAKIFYGDHDFINPAGEHDSPDFKPIRFDFHMFLSRDYLTQACVIHRDLLPPIDPDDIFVMSEVELFRIIASNTSEKFAHIPRILASLKTPNAQEMFDNAAKKTKILQDLLLDVFHSTNIAVSVEQNPQLPIIRNVSFQHNAAAQKYPKASIIIPTRDNIEMLAPAVSTVLSMTTYPNFEVIIVDNGSTRQEMLDHLASITDPRVKIHVDPQAYNWSAINNQAAREVATGEVLVFLNDDTRVLAPGWLTELVGCALIPTVGAAGARLLYPHGLVQHVGVVSNSGLNGHIHKGLPISSPGFNAYAITVHEATAVTGACLAVTREKFNLVGGFLEALPMNFNDVAFCLELMKHNLVNIFCASAELQHFEGVSRNSKGLTPEAMKQIQTDGATLYALYPETDPYWNPNLLLTWVQNGQMVAGMGLDAFTYPSPDHAWGKPEIGRVMVVGNPGVASEESRNLDAIYSLAVAGYQCQIHSPPLLNAGPWDLRVPSIAAAAFKKLGISKIILSDIGENNLQLLSFLTQLDIPVEYRPTNAEAVCPRTNLMPNTFMCDKGYKNGICQACMDTNSSPHGNVIMPGYWAEWMRFISRIQSADMAYLEKPEYREAIEAMYGAGDQTK